MPRRAPAGHDTSMKLSKIRRRGTPPTRSHLPPSLDRMRPPRTTCGERAHRCTGVISLPPTERALLNQRAGRLPVRRSTQGTENALSAACCEHFCIPITIFARARAARAGALSGSRDAPSGLTEGAAKRQRGRGARHSAGASGPGDGQAESVRLLERLPLCVSVPVPPRREVHERRTSRQALGYTKSVCRLVARARPRSDGNACEDHRLWANRRPGGAGDQELDPA